jgi:hypothetical protein
MAGKRKREEIVGKLREAEIVLAQGGPAVCSGNIDRHSARRRAGQMTRLR